MVLFIALPARLFDCSQNIPGNKFSQSRLYGESFTQEELAWSPTHKGGDDGYWKQAWGVPISLRGQNRNCIWKKKGSIVPLVVQWPPIAWTMGRWHHVGGYPGNR